MQSAIEASPPVRPAIKILRASHLGMCFGVRDAIALAENESRRQPLTILGELVHNDSVLKSLRERGIGIEEQPAAVRTAAVMITAHGASEKTMERVRERGLHVLEATCPLVHHAHRAVQRLAREGYHPVIIGRRGHVEVRGLTEDLEGFDIVLTESDVEQLAARARFGVAAQTTQPIERVRHLVELIRQRFPDSEVKFVDTVCQPTKQRQVAAVELARESGCGDCDWWGTQAITRANCRRRVKPIALAGMHHVQSAGDLRAEWF